MAESQSDLQRTVDIVLEATPNVAPGLSVAERDLKAFQDRMAKMREQEARAAEKSAKGGVLGQLKGMLGEDSTFGLLAKTAAGTGAFAGLSFAASKLEDMSAKAAEVVNKFRDGRVSSGEMVNQIARGIPILGDLGAALGNVVEMFAGVGAARAEFDRINAAVDARMRSIDAERDAMRDMADLAANIAERTAMIGMEGFLRDLELARQGYRKLRAEIDQAAAQGGDKAAAPYEAQIGDLRKRRQTLTQSRDLIHSYGLGSDDALTQLADIDREIANAERLAEQARARVNAAANPARQEAARHAAAEEEAIRTREQQKAEKERQDAFKADLEARRKWHADYYKALEQQGKEYARNSERAQKAVEATLAVMGFMPGDRDVSASAPERRRFNFTGVAASEFGGTLGGYAAAGRERAALMSNDPEAQERERDRRDAHKRHEEFKKELRDLGDKIVRNLAPGNVGDFLN